MLILKSISLGPLHGYGILLRIQQIPNERLEILQGSFYSAIYRMEHRGWIEGEGGESENNRRARFYRPTRAGMRQLKAETAKWTDMAAVVAGILVLLEDQFPWLATDSCDAVSRADTVDQLIKLHSSLLRQPTAGGRHSPSARA